MREQGVSVAGRQYRTGDSRPCFASAVVFLFGNYDYDIIKLFILYLSFDRLNYNDT